MCLYRLLPHPFLGLLLGKFYNPFNITVQSSIYYIHGNTVIYISLIER